MIFSTKDEKFAIKTISKEEKRIFLETLLESYRKRILDQPKSKLIRILGAYKILPSGIYFILMEKVATINESCLLYDLKGSTVDRSVSYPEKKKILKDVNFLNSGTRIYLENDESEELIQIIKDDLNILKDVGIMDYSILLFLYNNKEKRPKTYPHYLVGESMSVSIIDIFQTFNSRKALERWYKVYIRRVSKHLLSATYPQEYCERLVNFMTSIFASKIPQELDSIIFN